MCGSSSRCHGFVCSLWLWCFLIILTYYFSYAMLELQWIAFCALEYTRSRLGQLLFFINFQLSYGPFLILTRKSRYTHNCRRGCYTNQTNNDLYLSKGKYIVDYLCVDNLRPVHLWEWGHMVSRLETPQTALHQVLIRGPGLLVWPFLSVWLLALAIHLLL